MSIDLTKATTLELTTRHAYAVINGRRWRSASRIRDNLAETKSTNGPKPPAELTEHQHYIIAESFRRFEATDVTSVDTPITDTEAHIKISVTLPAGIVMDLKAEAKRTGEKLSRIVARRLK